MTLGSTNYRYFNHNGGWPDFQSWRLDSSADGTWTLATLPALAEPLPPDLEDPTGPVIPAGVALTPDGSIYYTDAERDALRVIGDCGEDERIVVGGRGDEPGQLDAPRDVVWHPLRKALMVADTENHRIQLFAPPDMQLLGIWTCWQDAGQSASFRPGSLAVDAEGAVYVVDVDSHCLRKLTIDGGPARFSLPSTANEVAVNEVAVSEVAVVEQQGVTSVYVLDADNCRVVVCDTAGNSVRAADLEDVLDPQGFAATQAGVFVGDKASGLLRRYVLKLEPNKLTSKLIGEAPDYEGPIAGLAIAAGQKAGQRAAVSPDRSGSTLWLHPGGSRRPIPMYADGAYAERGLLWGGPFSAGASPVAWHRLQAFCQALSEDARVRLYFATAADPPDPTADSGWKMPTTGEEAWTPLARGPDALIATSSRRLSLAVELEGDGYHSPRLEQLRVAYDHPSLTRYLPEIYRTQTAGRDTLERFLALFESFYTDVESQIDALTGWLDPEGVPEAWLDWLAEWLAVDLEEEWSTERKREAIQTAFERYGWRGTPQGLREALRVQAGVDAQIIEPLLLSSWWQLPEEPLTDDTSPDAPLPQTVRAARLGLTTRLAAAEPQGAVVGTTAVADHSHLLRQEEYGMPLFESVAYRFTVYVPRTQIPDEDKLAEVRRVIEREKPAHTIYDLCIVEPTLRIGVQSVIGVDTVIGGEPPPPSQLGSGPSTDLVLGGGGSRIGQIRIGEIRLQ